MYVLALGAAKTAKSCERIAVTGRAGANTGMAELVVALALLIVFEYFIGFVDFFELGFVAAFFVWMKLNSLLAESFFDLISTGAFINTQNFIVISFFCHNLAYILALKSLEC